MSSGDLIWSIFEPPKSRFKHLEFWQKLCQERSDYNSTNGRAKSTFWAKNGQFDGNVNLSTLEKFGIIWKNLEYFGKKLEYFGKIRNNLECFEKNWNILEKFGIFWKNLEYFGKNWNIMEKFGIFWKKLEYFGKNWNILEKFGIFLKKLEYFGKIWNILEKFGIFWVLK